MDGTEWTTLGHGSTVDELLDAVDASDTFVSGVRPVDHLQSLADQHGESHRTNLRLLCNDPRHAEPCSPTCAGCIEDACKPTLTKGDIRRIAEAQ